MSMSHQAIVVKYILILTFFCTWGEAFTQTTGRSLVKGKISVPEGFEAEDISIFNQSSGKGTISSGKGEFELAMIEGDSLYFSAVQFKGLRTIVTGDVIESGYLRVEISEGLNELPEIIIRPHDLSGNLIEDINSVEVVTLKLPPMSAWEDNSPGGGSAPKNAVMNEIGGGANHFLLLVKAVNYLFPKKKRKLKDRELRPYEKLKLEKELRATYTDNFFLENFSIPTSEVSDFLNYCVENGFDTDLLGKNRELELLEALLKYSQEYQLLSTQNGSGN